MKFLRGISCRFRGVSEERRLVNSADTLVMHLFSTFSGPPMRHQAAMEPPGAALLPATGLYSYGNNVQYSFSVSKSGRVLGGQRWEEKWRWFSVALFAYTQIESTFPLFEFPTIPFHLLHLINVSWVLTFHSLSLHSLFLSPSRRLSVILPGSRIVPLFL